MCLKFLNSLEICKNNCKKIFLTHSMLFSKYMLSVHLQDYPNLDSIISNQDLLNQMNVARAICNVGLFLRKTHKLKVRLPLSECYIISVDAITIPENIIDVIQDELNIQNIHFETISSSKFEAYKKINLNFNQCGVLLGENMKKVIPMINAGNYDILDDDTIKVNECILKKSLNHFSTHIDIKTLDKNFVSGKVLDNHLMVLNTHITDDLIQECIARDFVRFVQDYRKTLNLNITDRIIIDIHHQSNIFEKMLQKHSEYIMKNTLSKINISNVQNELEFSNEYVNEVTIAIKKV